MTEQPEDSEALAALDAWKGYQRRWVEAGNGNSLAQMRVALDAAAAWRRAQPTSALASDARKITEALSELLDCPDIADNDYRDEETHEAERNGRSVLPLAESLPRKIEALEKEKDEAREANERDRCKVAETITAWKKALTNYGWLRNDGRGSYEFDDERYQREFGDALDLLEEVIAPLRKIATDFFGCPESHAGIADARMDFKARAEAAESQLSTVTRERDEWRSCAEEKIALLQHEVDAHRKCIETSNVFEEMWRSAEKETIDLESKLSKRDAEIGRVILDVAAERSRQISAEGWTPEHDDKHHSDDISGRAGEMARAAACYAIGGRFTESVRDGEQTFTFGAMPWMWPWKPEWWKPKDRRSNLVRAGALIIAEIERLDRAAKQDEPA